MYLPSKNQKSKVASPARAIRTIRNITYYNSPGRIVPVFVEIGAAGAIG